MVNLLSWSVETYPATVLDDLPGFLVATYLALRDALIETQLYQRVVLRISLLQLQKHTS